MKAAGSVLMSLLVQTTKASEVWSLSQVCIAPKNRDMTPESPLESWPARAWSTSSMTTIEGPKASMIRRACRVRSSVWPTSEPIRLPGSRISVGRPVSLPKGLGEATFPVPGGPTRRIPLALGLSAGLGRSARKQKLFRASSPPRPAKLSPPRYSVRRPLFFSSAALSCQIVPASRRW